MQKTILINGQNIEIFHEEKNNVDRFYSEVILEKEYKSAFEDKTIVDIGANIGTFCLYAYPFAKVIYAIEPVTVNYNNLVKTIITNNLTKIKPFKVAISNSIGKRWISTPGPYSDFMLGGGQGGHEPEEVDCTTLMQFVQSNNIDYIDVLKIDVEGEEFPIFKDPTMKELASKIGIIIGEIHDSVENIIPFIERLGYTVTISNRQLLARKI